MISIKRSDTPDILKTGLNPPGEGEMETIDAIDFFSDIGRHGDKYKKTGKRGARIEAGYEVYSDKTVRESLRKMANGKCAYCESRITTIYNGDIEHFRPKGGHCNESSKPVVKPGYYWLAADWKNLLFACPFCNQTNTHEITDIGGIREVVLGKHNQFPLRDETHRLNHTHGALYFIDPAAYEAAFRLEEADRLLINPFMDADIQRFFKYEDDGAILVNDGLSAADQKKAAESIRVYALHRLHLVASRREKIVLIKAQIKRVERAIFHYNTYYGHSNEENTWFEGIMREELAILKRFKDPDQEYAGLARFIIKKYFNEAHFI